MLLASGWACHDAPAPWEPPSEDGAAPIRRLTSSPGHDRSPAWSVGGDSILYVAESFGDLPRAAAVLVAVPSSGGEARTVFPLLQPDGAVAPEVHAPAVAPDDGRVAYAQLLSTGASVCVGQTIACDATDSLAAPPALQLGRVRVRRPGASSAPEADPALDLTFDGVELDESRHPFGLPGVWITRLYPFQRRFNDEGILPARPSWSPDADLLVTSDGLRLIRWRPADGTTAVIDGTEDGSSPAWSPVGGEIAFTRLVRGAELQTACEHSDVGPKDPVIVCVEERTEWPISRSVVAVVASGGGVPVEIGEGTEPAWSPDGQWIFVARPDGVWRLSVSGGAEERIDGTAGGREPAVSPDGRELAFSRVGVDGKGDIWVVRLP